MHSKYVVRDSDVDNAAIFLGSANYTNDSWGLQENNLLQLRPRPLAVCFSKNFADLLAPGKVTESPPLLCRDPSDGADVPVTVGFAPEQSPAIVKEIVGAITAARQRLLVASVVLSSGPILATLSEAIDRGMPCAGIYDGPQMDQVRRQWQAARVGADK